MNDMTALLMVRNEEYFVHDVVSAILDAPFEAVIIRDAGSTDSTPAILESFDDPRIDLKVHKRRLSPEANGRLRNHMMRQVKTEFAFMIDGDELYPPNMLKRIIEHPIPEGVLTGYILHLEVNLRDGKLWVVSKKSAHRLHHKSTTWRGRFPFDVASTHNRGDISIYYPGHKKKPEEVLYGYHLHALPRSSKDGDAHMRMQLKRLRNEGKGYPVKAEDLPIFKVGLAKAKRHLADKADRKGGSRESRIGRSLQGTARDARLKSRKKKS